MKIEGPIKLPLLLSSGKVEETNLYLFQSSKENYHVLVKGEIKGKKDVLLRIESACTYAHLYGSQLCDCEWQLKEALKLILENGQGILIYALDQHGRGIGLLNHVKVYIQEQNKGFDTVEAHKSLGLEVDARDYSDILEIIAYFDIKSVKLLTNNPNRIDFFEKNRIKVERVPLETELNEYNENELRVKKRKMGHLYSFN